MSRIATLTAVLTMAVASAAFAGPADLRAPDQHTAARAALTQVYAHQDLRSPDAVNGFVSPTATAKPAAISDGSSLPWWALLAMITAAFCACGLLTVMLRRHFDVGRPARV